MMSRKNGMLLHNSWRGSGRLCPSTEHLQPLNFLYNILMISKNFAYVW